jgi:hypothetical protein
VRPILCGHQHSASVLRALRRSVPRGPQPRASIILRTVSLAVKRAVRANDGDTVRETHAHGLPTHPSEPRPLWRAGRTLQATLAVPCSFPHEHFRQTSPFLRRVPPECGSDLVETRRCGIIRFSASWCGRWRFGFVYVTLASGAWSAGQARVSSVLRVLSTTQRRIRPCAGHDPPYLLVLKTLVTLETRQ